MPDSLLQDPCTVVGAGTTVRTLSRAYIKNADCVGQYQLLLKKQREFKQSVLKTYADMYKRSGRM